MWINEQTQGIFVLHTDIRYECWKDGKELPGVLDDAILAANGYAVVTEVKPTFDPITQELVRQAPIKGEDGAWTLGYIAIELDPAIITNNRNVAEAQRLYDLERQLAFLDMKKIKALTDAILLGDTTKLIALEEEAKIIRTEINK
jgi:hypothetical protein